MGGHWFWWGVGFERSCKMGRGGGTHAPPLWETLDIYLYIYIFEQLKKGVSSKETSFPN